MVKKIVIMFWVFAFLGVLTAEAEDKVELQCQVQQNVKFCVDKKGQTFSGKYENYNEKGLLQSVENYNKGYLSGLATYWSAKGKLKERLYYKNGIKNGMDKVYYENRTIKYLLNYKEGELNGRMDIYTKEGKLKGRLYYEKGALKSGFCVDDNDKYVQQTPQKIAKFPHNKLETCGVQ